MRSILCACLLSLLAASTAHAQAVTSYTVRVYAQGAPAPQTTTVIPAASFICNQTPLTVTGTPANPTKLAFDDPANAGKSCLYVDPGNGVLLSLPFGSQIYDATIAATNSAGTSAESLVSNPFSHPGVPPPVLTGVKVSS